MALVKIGQLLACVLREVLAMFGIEDCVMGGLNQHQVLNSLLDFPLAKHFSNPEWVLIKPLLLYQRI